MSRLTAKQREVLRYRLERAIRWDSSLQYERDNATRAAKVALSEIEYSGTSSSLTRRAVENVVKLIDEKLA